MFISISLESRALNWNISILVGLGYFFPFGVTFIPLIYEEFGKNRL
jgi:hypothetical protein